MPFPRSVLPFLWPPKVRLAFYGRGDRLIFESAERDLDLSDSLMLHWNAHSRCLRFGVSTTSAKWPAWTEEAVRAMEWRIRYDLGFDGYRVVLNRLTSLGAPCSDEFRWAMRIRTLGFETRSAA